MYGTVIYFFHLNNLSFTKDWCIQIVHCFYLTILFFIYNIIIFILLCMNCFKFLYLNNLLVTKGMSHNSNLMFLLNYLRKKNHTIVYLQI
jgi:hypothetical protein